MRGFARQMECFRNSPNPLICRLPQSILQSGKHWFSLLFPFFLPLPLFAALAVGPILRELPICDFGMLYYPARMVLDGHGRLLYDLHEQHLYQILCARPQTLFFYYPAATVVPFLAVAELPIRTAILIWDTFSLLLIIGCAAAFARQQSFAERIRNGLLTFAFAPLMYLALEGQTTALVLVALTAAWWEWRRAHEFRGGMFLALGLLKFHLLAGFCLILLARRRWRTLGGLAVGAACLYLVSAVIAGPAWPLHEFQIALIGEKTGAPVGLMPNLHGLVQALTGGSHPFVVGVLSLAVILLAARSSGDSDRDFSKALLASLLVSWHMNPHDMILALVPFWLGEFAGLGRGIWWVLATAMILSSWAVEFQSYGFLCLLLLVLLVALAAIPSRGSIRAAATPALA